MTTIAERLESMFPADPLLPALVAACDRNDAALAVYMTCDLWRRRWSYPTTDQNLAAYVRNPVWPENALILCFKYDVPAPSWVVCWAASVAMGNSKRPNPKDREAADLLDRVWAEITEPGPDGDGAHFLGGDQLALAQLRKGDRRVEVVAFALGLTDKSGEVKGDRTERLIRLCRSLLADTFETHITEQRRKPGRK